MSGKRKDGVYTIGEASKILEVKEHVLRFWEKEFKELAPNKTETGRRYYTEQDIQTIQTIKELLYKKKYTIAGAKRKLKTNNKASTPSPQYTEATSIHKHIIEELRGILQLLND